MVQKVTDGQLGGNKTVPSIGQLKCMTKQQLLTIFDSNNSNTVSNSEIAAQGIEGEDLLEIKAHVSSLGIGEKDEVAKEAADPKPPRKTVKVGGVTFYADEVISSYSNEDQSWHIVKTTFGTFNYDTHIGDASILSGHISNAVIYKYLGNDKKNTLYVENQSYLKSFSIADESKDKIYVYSDSDLGTFSKSDLDANDEIWFIHEDDTKEVRYRSDIGE